MEEGGQVSSAVQTQDMFLSLMAFVPGSESEPWLALFTTIGTAIKFTAKHSRCALFPSGKGGGVGS